MGQTAESRRRPYLRPAACREYLFGDEEAVRVRDALAPGGTIANTYDLGACWEHEITLEATIPRDQSQDYPVCAGFRGDSPSSTDVKRSPRNPNRSA